MSGALEWRDVTNARDEDGRLIAVRRGKTNPDGRSGRGAARSCSRPPGSTPTPATPPLSVQSLMADRP